MIPHRDGAVRCATNANSYWFADNIRDSGTGALRAERRANPLSAELLVHNKVTQYLYCFFFIIWQDWKSNTETEIYVILTKFSSLTALKFSKISYPYIERYEFYTILKIQELSDLRARMCFETLPVSQLGYYRYSAVFGMMFNLTAQNRRPFCVQQFLWCFKSTPLDLLTSCWRPIHSLSAGYHCWCTVFVSDLCPLGAMAGKVALITGAAKGLGKEFCRVLLNKGARVSQQVRYTTNHNAPSQPRRKCNGTFRS